MLSHLFTTPVLRLTGVLTPEQLGQARDILLQMRERSNGLQISNRGGWHSEGNLFDSQQYAPLPGVQEAVTRALFQFINEAFGYTGPIQLSLTGWTVINKPGHYNTPHNHSSNLLSGALYISVPEGMRGGQIVFQDPRLNVNAHSTPAMQQLGVRPPWFTTSVSVEPAPGDILVFPSWLMHYVEPYECTVPEAVRIVLSFNARIE